MNLNANFSQYVCTTSILSAIAYHVIFLGVNHSYLSHAFLIKNNPLPQLPVTIVNAFEQLNTS